MHIDREISLVISDWLRILEGTKSVYVFVGLTDLCYFFVSLNRDGFYLLRTIKFHHRSLRVPFLA